MLLLEYSVQETLILGRHGYTPRRSSISVYHRTFSITVLLSKETYTAALKWDFMKDRGHLLELKKISPSSFSNIFHQLLAIFPAETISSLLLMASTQGIRRKEVIKGWDRKKIFKENLLEKLPSYWTRIENSGKDYGIILYKQ